MVLTKTYHSCTKTYHSCITYIPVIFAYDNYKKAFLIYGSINDIYNGDDDMSIYSHYMIITGVIKLSDELKNILGFGELIQFASAGKKYMAIYDDFGDNLSMTTNILGISKVD